jgi:hypothetical protein
MSSKILRRVGVGLLALGAVWILMSSGAFDATEAGRGVDVTVAEDADAFVGVETPDSLVLEQADGEQVCNFSIITCLDGFFEYENEELATFTDRVSSDVVVDGTDVSVDDGVSDPSVENFDVVENNNEYVVEGDLTCDADCPPFVVDCDQIASSTTVTVNADIGTTDGTFGVELEREIPAECQ